MEALCASACSGTDHLTEPLVAVGGTYLDSLGITPNTVSAGGSVNSLGGAASDGISATGGNGTTTTITSFGTSNRIVVP